MREDTRSRIQEVALELFTEQGYEATSLREIAERLGVTKAALYYHFKTKDDIVASFMADRTAALSRLIEWAREQPRTQETRRELLRRYGDVLSASSHHKVMRFLERNQTALRQHPKSELMREVMISLAELLSERGDPLQIRLKNSMALFAMHGVWFIAPHEKYADQDRAAAALEVALELIESADAERRATR
ncbi:MAG: TetR family transcriptional regulator [Actinobacteria bacterium 13_1_20CM_3_71_11]|nr:MAG: TetR family transcriptional regulator [Actinobacteria bacterium 13_1_20CM_3_71_11]